MSLDLLIMNTQEFGKRLKERREALDLTQDDVASATKGLLSRGGLSQWESGKTQKISAEALLLVAKRLRTTNEYLLYGIEPIKLPEAALAEVWDRLTPEQQQHIVDIARIDYENNQKVIVALGKK